MNLQNFLRKGYGVVLVIKSWFDELIYGYLGEESMWCDMKEIDRLSTWRNHHV